MIKKLKTWYHGKEIYIPPQSGDVFFSGGTKYERHPTSQWLHTLLDSFNKHSNIWMISIGIFSLLVAIIVGSK